MDSYTVGRENEHMAETETKQKNPIQWKNILLKTGIILCRLASIACVIIMILNDDDATQWFIDNWSHILSVMDGGVFGLSMTAMLTACKHGWYYILDYDTTDWLKENKLIISFMMALCITVLTALMIMNIYVIISFIVSSIILLFIMLMTYVVATDEKEE